MQRENTRINIVAPSELDALSGNGAQVPTPRESTDSKRPTVQTMLLRLTYVALIQ